MQHRLWQIIIQIMSKGHSYVASKGQNWSCDIFKETFLVIQNLRAVSMVAGTFEYQAVPFHGWAKIITFLGSLDPELRLQSWPPENNKGRKYFNCVLKIVWSSYLCKLLTPHTCSSFHAHLAGQGGTVCILQPPYLGKIVWVRFFWPKNKR